MGVAYRMLGSRTEADDAVQETWLRLDHADVSAVENLTGWLTTIVTRVCLDRLRVRKARPEDLVGKDLPEEEAMAVTDEVDPERQVLLAESVGSALLVVLDMLAPAERVAFVLHDIFAMPFGEIGPIIDRSPEAARQLASRARRRLQGVTAVPDLDLTLRREVVDAFLVASRSGDFDALLTVLDPDVRVRADATARKGGDPERAQGARAVATWFSRGAQGLHLAIVDGAAGIVWAPQGPGHLQGVLDFTIKDRKIIELYLIADPERIDLFDIVLVDD